MCRTGKVYSQCPDCGADLRCETLIYCDDCYAKWCEVDDSELESA